MLSRHIASESRLDAAFKLASTLEDLVLQACSPPHKSERSKKEKKTHTYLKYFYLTWQTDRLTFRLLTMVQVHM